MGYKSDERAKDKLGKKGGSMWRLLKFLIFLILVAAIAVIVYAYLGDLQPNRIEINEPVTIDVN